MNEPLQVAAIRSLKKKLVTTWQKWENHDCNIQRGNNNNNNNNNNKK